MDVSVLDAPHSVLLVPLRVSDTPPQDKTHNPRTVMHEPVRNRNASVLDARDMFLRNVAFEPLVVVVVHVLEEPQLEGKQVMRFGWQLQRAVQKVPENGLLSVAGEDTHRLTV
jgi:hypothetical protein